MKPKGRDLLKTLIMLMEDQYGCNVKYELEGEEDEEVQIERKRADTACSTWADGGNCGINIHNDICNSALCEGRTS